MIKQVSDLPTWFQRSKYENAKNLDETGWYIQLTARSSIMSLVGSLSDDKGKESRLKEVVNLIRATPIIDLTDSRLLRFINDAIVELQNNKPKFTLGVRSMTINELYNHTYWLDPKKREFMQTYWNKIITGDPTVSFELPKWAHDPVQDIGREIERHPLSINLTLPDAVLLDQLKQLLPKLREETGTDEWAKQLKRHDFNDWIYFGALPCIDLKIWAKEENLQITNRVIADAIFADGEGGEEIVRKTVNPLIDWLLNFDSHSILAAEAAIKVPD